MDINITLFTCQQGYLMHDGRRGGTYSTHQQRDEMEEMKLVYECVAQLHKDTSH